MADRYLLINTRASARSRSRQVAQNHGSAVEGSESLYWFRLIERQHATTPHAALVIPEGEEWRLSEGERDALVTREFLEQQPGWLPEVPESEV